MLVGAAVVTHFFLRRLSEDRKRHNKKKHEKKEGFQWSDHTARSTKSV